MQKPLLLRLTNLIFVILLPALAVSAMVSFFQKSYISSYLLLSGAGFLYLTRRWSDFAKITLILVCLVIYLAAYLTNVLLVFMQPRLEPSEQRLHAARRLGVTYDTRTRLQMMAHLQEQGIDAVPVLSPHNLVLTGKSLPGPGRRLLPLGGIAQKTTVFCNECGDYAIYQADERGFNNPRGSWSQPPLDVLIIGDSYAHGACVPPGDDLASLLRRGDKKVLNLGYCGNGPLLELGGLREYAQALKPKVVLWMYYEGNDLIDLARERNCSFLTRYLLDNSYSQDLIHQQAAIDLAWTDYLETSQAREEIKSCYYHYRSFLSFMRSFQLNKLTQTILEAYDSISEYYYPKQVPSFRKIIIQAQSLVNSWGGTLFFVYLPDYHRYAGKAMTYPLNQRDHILSMVQSLCIPLIDFHSTLSRLPDPLAAFPFRTNAHYNKEGYKMLAQQIANSLKDSPPAGVANFPEAGGRP